MVALPAQTRSNLLPYHGSSLALSLCIQQMVEPYKWKTAHKPPSLDEQHLQQAEQNGWKRYSMALRGKFWSKFQKPMAYKTFALKHVYEQHIKMS